MFYTEILRHDPCQEYTMIDTKCRYDLLKDTIPSFFTRETDSHKVHAVILCSNCNIKWTNQLFLGQFNDTTDLSDNRPGNGFMIMNDRYSVCSLSEGTQEDIYEAIVAIAKEIKSFYGNCADRLLGVSEGLKTARSSGAAVWSDVAAANSLLTAFPRTLDFSLYLLVRLPYECFESIKKFYLPTFIEFVVKESANDPDKEKVETDFAATKQSYEELKKQYEELLRQVKDILNEITQSTDKLNSQESNQENIFLLREKWRNLSEIVERKWKDLSELENERENKAKTIVMR